MSIHFIGTQKADAWNSVITGMKWWILFPQDISANEEFKSLMECNPLCSDSRIDVLDWISSFLWSNQEPSVDDLFRESAIHVFLKEGETLYVPSGMMHR